MRVLHCPTSTGGNPQGLAHAERLLGLESKSVVFSQNYLQYPCDETLWEQGASLTRQQVLCWSLLMRASHKFDVIHYNAGTTILPWSFSSHWAKPHTLKWLLYLLYSRTCKIAERSFLKRKVIAVTFQGDDARQGDYCRTCFQYSIAHETGETYYTPESDRRTRERISSFTHYADLIYALNPDLLRVLPPGSKFMPYAHLRLEEWTPVDGVSKRIPLVVHAPSHRGAKGTEYVISAVNRLQSEGVQIDLSLVENKSNAEAKKRYEKADLIIDQLLAGWYGGFAVEAMALGKPVICYLREADFQFLPDGMAKEIPIINASPMTVYDVLRDWLVNRRHEFHSRGEMSRKYVEKWHNPLHIASKLRSDYLQVFKTKRTSMSRRLMNPCAG